MNTNFIVLIISQNELNNILFFFKLEIFQMAVHLGGIIAEGKEEIKKTNIYAKMSE